MVLQDVVNGYVSLRSAREDYGVVIDEAGMKVNLDASLKLRDSMKASTGG